MRAGIGLRLTYANVVATLCLFLLIGGGAAFAATELGRNSVGTKQLRDGAVTLRKVRESAQFALRGERGPAGPQGEAGPKGPKGVRGEAGQGASGFASSSLASPLPDQALGQGYWLLDSAAGGRSVSVDSKAQLVVQGTATIDAGNVAAAVAVVCQAYLHDAAGADTPVGPASEISVRPKVAETISVLGYAPVTPGTWALRLGCYSPAASGQTSFEAGALTAIATG